MKLRNLAPYIVAAFSVAFVFAAPTDEVTAAAKKLGDAPNYTWTVALQAGGGSGNGFGGATTGKAEKGGYSIVTRETPNGARQTVRKGEAVALQNFQSGEWISGDEFIALTSQGRDGPGIAPGRGAIAFLGTGGTQPATEIAQLIATAKNLTAADGIIGGSLEESAVAQRLVPGPSGRSRGGDGDGLGIRPAPKNASGSVKFWLKDGAIVKYELNLKGTVAGRDGKEREIDRTTTTEIKDVGTTKVEVPEAAKKKLGS